MIHYPLLTALYGRGGATWTGAPLSWLRVEAKGERLFISGMTPLVDDGERFIQDGSAYSYILEGEEIKEAHDRRQPVLVGTITIETSELLSKMLKREGIPHQVLNAKFHELEAEIVSHAGEAGTVTIATNMAGRGTDIKLDDEARAAGGLDVPVVREIPESPDFISPWKTTLCACSAPRSL